MTLKKEDDAEELNYEKIPTVSLLIPVRNEAEYIENCLKSVISQDYPSNNLEILVIDGLSTDSSTQIVSRAIQRYPNIKLLSNPTITQSAAWNLGINISRSEIIGIVSAHAELAPDFVSQAVRTLRRTRADLVGGPTRPHCDSWVGKTISIAMSTPFGVGGGRFHYTNKEETVDTVFMGLCWRKMYLKIGGFDEEMVRNQDDELSYRLLDQGGRIVCNPDIRSRYYNRSTLRSLWHQFFQYGFWKVRVWQKHPRQIRPRQFVPPIFVSSLLLSGISAFLIPLGKWMFALVAGGYILTNLIVSCWLATRKGWRYLFLLPIVFAILHISYGLGFLVGLAKFANCWGDKLGKVPTFEQVNVRSN